MKLISIMSGLLLPFFITDCDKTIVHYDRTSSNIYESNDNSTNTNTSTSTTPSINHDELIEMPASAGSGKVGYISRATIHYLTKISKYTTIICASGMREATMRQRQSLIPSINYWVCENGGRIFYRKSRPEAESKLELESESEPESEFEVVENIEFRDFVLHESERLGSINSLKSLTDVLIDENWSVDVNYESMIRVKLGNKESFKSVIDRIPSNLKYTFNLGHLDIQYAVCGKLAATQWLMNHLQRQRQRQRQEQQSRSAYFFMGDDDNDIEIAASADEAFILNPCSDAMQQFLDSMESKATGATSKYNKAVSLHHRGSEEVLKVALDKLMHIAGSVQDEM